MGHPKVWTDKENQMGLYWTIYPEMLELTHTWAPIPFLLSVWAISHVMFTQMLDNKFKRKILANSEGTLVSIWYCIGTEYFDIHEYVLHQAFFTV